VRLLIYLVDVVLIEEEIVLVHDCWVKLLLGLLQGGLLIPIEDGYRRV
jgi:hypothetical protein